MTAVAIAGGGIAGLAVAHEIIKRNAGIDLVVLEAGERPGGNIRSERIGGYLCEWGADGFLANAPDTLRVIREAGLEDRLLPSNDAARRRFVFRKGRLREVPVSPGAFLLGDILSTRAKVRIALEPFAAARTIEDETIHAFAARRIGEEAATVLVDSMVSGIFAGDAHALSLRACFPRMWQMETDHGGLFRALVATRKRRSRADGIGAPAGRLTSFAGGMADLIDGLAARLGARLHTSTPVQGIDLPDGARPGSRTAYRLLTPRGTFDADAVVLAGPASVAAALLRPVDADMAGHLSGIETAPLVVVCLGFDSAALERNRGPLNGFGFLVPRNEGLRMLGALWESSIYPDRAPAGKSLIRVMVGGARDHGAVALDDETLMRTVLAELKTSMGLDVTPEFVRIVRHHQGIPQYTRGHLDRLAAVESRLAAHPGLFLAGNSYRGVAVNNCITEAGPLAERVLAHVHATTGRVSFAPGIAQAPA